MDNTTINPLNPNSESDKILDLLKKDRSRIITLAEIKNLVQLQTINAHTRNEWLMYLVQRQDKEIVEIITYLIDQGANVNFADENHYSILMRAVSVKDNEQKTNIIRCLLNAGANIHYQNDHYSILSRAAGHSNGEVLKLITDKNTSSDHLDQALYIAMSHENVSAVKALLQVGASPFSRIEDLEGQNSLEFILEYLENLELMKAVLNSMIRIKINEGKKPFEDFKKYLSNITQESHSLAVNTALRDELLAYSDRLNTFDELILKLNQIEGENTLEQKLKDDLMELPFLTKRLMLLAATKGLHLEIDQLKKMDPEIIDGFVVGKIFNFTKQEELNHFIDHDLSDSDISKNLSPKTKLFINVIRNPDTTTEQISNLQQIKNDIRIHTNNFSNLSTQNMFLWEIIEYNHSPLITATTLENNQRRYNDQTIYGKLVEDDIRSTLHDIIFPTTTPKSREGSPAISERQVNLSL